MNIKGIQLSRKLGRRADINTDYDPPNMHYNKDLQAWEFHVIYANFKKTRDVFIIRDDKDVKIVEKFMEKVPLKTGANFYNIEGNSIYCVTRRGDSHV